MNYSGQYEYQDKREVRGNLLLNHYYCDPEKGEEEQTFWVNEAWEGTKIGWQHGFQKTR